MAAKLVLSYHSGKRNPIILGLYCAAVPFGLLWVFKQTPVAAFCFQVYLVTACVFVVGPFELQKEYVKKRLFWKAMLWGGAIIHPLFLAALWHLDMTYAQFISGKTGNVILLAFVASLAEALVLARVVTWFFQANREES
jgi:hypothetical protein